MRETAFVVLVTVVFFAFGSVVPRQYAALRGAQAARLPVHIAAQRIRFYAEEHLPDCFHALDGRAAELTRALIAVEYVSVSRVEYMVEYAVAQFAQFGGAPLPDLSYGVAQVRPSTVAKLRLASGGVPPQARDFIDDCANIEIARTITASLLAKHRDVTPADARLSRVIRDYSGQLQYRPEYVVHNAIVARLCAEYRCPEIENYLITTTAIVSKG